MKRKNVSARILPGVLAFSMVAATGTSSMTVLPQKKVQWKQSRSLEPR